MSPKIKNIIIFGVAAIILILAYFLFFKPAPEQANLTTTTTTGDATVANVETSNTTIGADFLNTLLSVKNINLDDSIFSDPSFASLHDSSIVLVPDTTQGRPNPFLPIGTDVLSTTNAAPSTSTTDGTGISGTVGAPTAPTDASANAVSGTGTSSDTNGTTGTNGTSASGTKSATSSGNKKSSAQ